MEGNAGALGLIIVLIAALDVRWARSSLAEIGGSSSIVIRWSATSGPSSGMRPSGVCDVECGAMRRASVCDVGIGAMTLVAPGGGMHSGVQFVGPQR